MSNQAAQFTTPVGRLVWGSVYKPQEKDADGNPLVIKNGPNAGQPTKRWSFGVAIAKAGEQHWSQTPWGKIIWDTGFAAFPQGQGNSPAFSWKVMDGDSAIPNTKGNKPCDREGYPGHWIIAFSSSYAPSVWDAKGKERITQEDAVKCGYFVQVHGNVTSNASAMKPGVHVNHNMVAFSAYGPEIQQSQDASAVGFGQSPLPAGATAVPAAAFAPAPQPATTGYAAPVAAAPTMQMAAPAPQAAPVAVQPHYAILGAGAPVPPAPPVAVVAAPPVRQMTAAAGGATYEQFIAQGWTDDLLRAQGMML